MKGRATHLSIAIVALATATALANTNGTPNGGTATACVSCHAGSGLTASFSTTAAGQYPGQTATYSIRVGLARGVGPSAARAGTNIHASGGALSVAPGEPLIVANEEIVHNESVTGLKLKSLTGGSAVYSFLFQVPTTAVPGSTQYTINGVAAAGHTQYANLIGTAAASTNLVVSAVRPADPTSLQVTNLQPASATLSWSGAGPEYRLLYKLNTAPSGPADATATILDTAATSATLTLAADKKYYVALYARATFFETSTFSASSRALTITTPPASDPNPWVDVATGNDTNYGSRLSPFKTINRALQSVAQGGTITVQPGRYSMSTGETFPIQPRQGSPGFTLISSGGPTVTIIDATGANKRVMEFDTDSWISVQGFTITGGLLTITNDSKARYLGAGVLALGPITIDRCIITGNEGRGDVALTPSEVVDVYGGGVYLGGVNARIANSIVSNNIARGGKGFSGTTAGPGGNAIGAGIASPDNSASIVNCSVYGNQAIGGAGGDASGSGATGGRGGGGWAAVSTSGSLINTIVAANSTTAGSGGQPGGAAGASGSAGVSAHISDSNLLFNNQGETNADPDPLFVNPPLDLHLRSNSPARGAGVTNTGVPPFDLDGIARPSRPTIGAYEAGLSLTATEGIGRITLTWPGVTGAFSYNVYMSSSPGAGPLNFERKFAGATSPLVIAPLPNNTTKYFVITAIENGIEGPSSAQATATTSNGTWVPTGPAVASDITAVTRDLSGPALYAATGRDAEATLYKSTDAGETWVPLPRFVPARNGFDTPSDILGISANGQTIVAATWADIYTTHDGGQTWTEAFPKATTGFSSRIAIDPLAPSNVYGGNYQISGQPAGTDLLVRSVDGGATFTNVPSGDLVATSIQVDPTMAGTVYAAGTRSATPVRKSTNSGATYTNISPTLSGPLQHASLALASSSPWTLFFGCDFGIYKTVDAGGNWTAMNNGLPEQGAVIAVHVDPADATRAHVGFELGYYLTNDGANSWTPGPAGGRFPSASMVLTAFAQTTNDRLIGLGLANLTTPFRLLMRPVYPPPAFTSESPTSGSPAGGETVTISGANFRMGAGFRVLFGASEAVVNAGASSSTSVVVTTPPGVTGPIDIAIVNPDGQAAIRTNAFTYGGCDATVSPAVMNYSSASATGNISVSAQCAWTATAPAGSFVTITGGGSGTGAGTVSYSVAQNSTSSSRTTTLTIAGKSVVISQSASGAAASLLNASAGSSSVTLSWTTVSGAVNYEIQRSSNASGFLAIGTTTSLGSTDNSVTAGTGYLYRIRALAPGGEISYSNIDLAVPFAYSAPTVTAGSTVIRAADLLELRQAINAARATVGWLPTTFTDEALSGVPMKRVHVLELRSSLDAVRAALALPPIVYTDATLTAGGTLIKAAHINDLRNGVK